MVSIGRDQDALDRFVGMKVNPVDSTPEGGVAAEIINTGKALFELGIPEEKRPDFMASSGPGSFEFDTGIIGGSQNHRPAKFPTGIFKAEGEVEQAGQA